MQSRSFSLADYRPSAEKIQNRPLTDKSLRTLFKAETMERTDCNGPLPNSEMCTKLSGWQNSLCHLLTWSRMGTIAKKICGIERVLPAVGVARLTRGNITHRMSGSISSCTLTNLSSVTFPLIQAISQDCWEVFLLHKWRLEEKSRIRTEYFSPSTPRVASLGRLVGESPAFIAFMPQRGRHEC